MQFTKMDDVNDLLFHYYTTHIFVLFYLKDSMAGRGVRGRFGVLELRYISSSPKNIMGSYLDACPA